MHNIKKFNIYVFISSFARNLIEVFIPLILYNFGYSLKSVMFYYFLVNFISLIIGYIFIRKIKTEKYKMLSVIGIFAFIFIQLMLNNLVLNTAYIILLAFLYAIYRRGYWIPRRFYNLKVIPEKDISLTYTVVSIINQCAVISSAFIGSLILDCFNIKILTGISITLFFASIIPLHYFKIDSNEDTEKIQLFDTLKKIPSNKKYLFGTYELTNVIKFLIPLYLAIYVRNRYQVVGILNLSANFSTLIFSYFYGKKINGKKNYLKFSIFLLILVYVFKINVTNFLLIIICFFEGIATKMQEISVNKEFFVLSKKIDYANYNCAYECIQNFIRTIVTLVLFCFGKDVKTMIYFTMFFMGMNIFLNFNDKKELSK